MNRFRGRNAIVTGASRGIDVPNRWRALHVSLDLLDELGITVMTLDGGAPYPGGQRVARS